MNRISRRPAAEAAEALLEVGRTQPVLHYDVELGLERHHHWLQHEAPMPEWASASVGTAAKSLVPVVVKTIVSALLVGTVAVAAWHARGGPQPSAARSKATERAPGAPPSAPDAREIPLPVSDPGLPSEPSEPPVVHRSVRADVPDKRAPRSPRAHREPASARVAALPRSAGHDDDDARTSGSVARASVSTAASAMSSSGESRQEVAAATEAKPIRLAPKARPERGAQAEEPSDMLEMQQVATAQQLLERSPQRALTLVRQGDQRFARGYFQQERAYIAIMALIRLGRIDEARTRAASFSKRFPALPYGARIRSALEARGAGARDAVR
jgi:hypothetical protein